MKLKPFLAIAGVIVVSAALAQSTMAFSLKELLGFTDEEEAEQEESGGGLMGTPAAQEGAAVIPGDQNWGKPSGNVTKVAFDMGVLQRILENVDATQRTAVLSDSDAFHRFARQEADAASLLQAARANNVHQDPNIAFAMQRAAENVLRDVYLNRLIASKIPSDFPTEEQARKYFEENKARLVVPERVQVWQIYLPFAKGMDEKARTALTQKAEGIVKDLGQNRISFAEAAQKFSGHEASRLRGGDMGLVPISDLKADIKQPLLALPEGQISAPVKTGDGVHIFKRGAKAAAQPLEYSAIKDQLRQTMVKQARSQLRNAIVEQARKTYTVELEDKKIEEMRLRLRTDLAPAKDKNAAAKPST